MIVLIIAEPPRARRSPIAKKKDKNGKEKFKRVLNFVFVDKRKLFVTKLSFEEFHLVFFTAEHLACFGKANQGTKVFEEILGTFFTLSIIKENTFLKGNFCI